MTVRHGNCCASHQLDRASRDCLDGKAIASANDTSSKWGLGLTLSGGRDHVNDFLRIQYLSFALHPVVLSYELREQ